MMQRATTYVRGTSARHGTKAARKLTKDGCAAPKLPNLKPENTL